MRVVIADDSVLLREGLARVLAEGGFEVVAQAGDADELATRCDGSSPTSRSSTSACRRRRPTRARARRSSSGRSIPRSGSSLLSQVVEARARARALQRAPGGFGYLLKDRVLEIDDFLDAVRRVGRGGTAIDPEVVAQLLGRQREDDPLAELTPREREVLELMAEGLSNRGICEKCSSARRRSRRTSRASSGSSASCRRRTTTAACWRCSRTCARSLADTTTAAPADAPGPRISSSATLYPLAARDYQRCPLLTTRFTFVPAGLRRPGRGLCAITRPRGRAERACRIRPSEQCAARIDRRARGAASPGHEEPRRTPAETLGGWATTRPSPNRRRWSR